MRTLCAYLLATRGGRAPRASRVGYALLLLRFALVLPRRPVPLSISAALPFAGVAAKYPTIVFYSFVFPACELTT